MIDWSTYPAVTRRPGVLSGCPALRDDPRVPPETIIETMDAGETAEDVIANFGLKTLFRNVLAIYQFSKAARVKMRKDPGESAREIARSYAVRHITISRLRSHASLHA